MFLSKIFKKHRPSRINDTKWECILECPKCGTRHSINPTSLRVISIPDWSGERIYEFRVECNSCRKLTIVVPKDKIPYNVKENVLAENTPIIDNGFL